MAVDSHQISFLQAIFKISYDGTRLIRSRFRRDELLPIYKSTFGKNDGFGEVMDALVFEKMLGMVVSTSRTFTEYYLTGKAVETLAASGSSDRQTLDSSDFALSPEQSDCLASDLNEALSRVADLPLSQERKAQIRSLILAAITLSEAPEPPVNIIKLLLSDADRIINIAGFFVGLASLVLGLL